MIFIIAFELPMLVGHQILVAGIDPVLGEVAGGDEIGEIELANSAFDAQPELAGIRCLPTQKRARLEKGETARGDALRRDGGIFHPRTASSDQSGAIFQLDCTKASPRFSLTSGLAPGSKIDVPLET